MSLLAYNLTAAPVVLTGGFATLPASASVPNPTIAVNVTAVLQGLTGPQYAALEVQRAAGTTYFLWSDEPTFAVGTLQVYNLEAYSRRFWKDPVLVCSSLNTIGPPTGGATMDGVVLATGDRACIALNTFTPAETGIYLVNTAGLWTRPLDFQVDSDARGTIFEVLSGALRAGQIWHQTKQPPSIVGTDVLTWDVAIVGGISPGPFIGGTAYQDASTNTGIVFNAFLGFIYHNGGLTFDFRGSGSTGPCSFVPYRTYSSLGLSTPNYYDQWVQAAFIQRGSRQEENTTTPTPAAPTVTTVGAAGAETRTYKIIARRSPANYLAQNLLIPASQTPASAGGTNVNGNAVLDTVNYNQIDWVDVAGAYIYDIYLTASTVGGEVLGKVGSVVQTGQQFLHRGEIADGVLPPATRTVYVDTFFGEYQVIALTADTIWASITDGGAGAPIGALSGSGTGTLEAQTITIGFKQNAAGGWVLTSVPSSNIRFAGGAMAALSPGANAIDLYTFRWDKTVVKWIEQSRSLNV